MDYVSKILNRLLDKYENSGQSWKTQDVERKVLLKVDVDSVFENYWAEDSYNYRSEIEETVKYLAKKHLVYFEIDKNSGLLKKVFLLTENVDEAFKFVNRHKKNDKRLNHIKYINSEISLYNQDSVVYRFLVSMLAKLKANRAHASYFETLDELKLIITIINGFETNENEVLLRNFSKKIKGSNDSKLVEKYAARVLKIFNEFGYEQFIGFSELCAAHYIEVNKSYVYIKNGLRIKINSQIIDFDKLGYDLSLSEQAITSMEILEVYCRKVITVENLTTFNYLNDNDAIIIYLGGYHNKVKQQLITKLHSFDNLLEWYHMGDIDWGGFEILLHLRRETGINFKPLKMGIEELECYKNECQCLTSNDKRRLQKLAENPDAEEFKPVIDYMLKCDFKLEQESIE